MSNNGDKLFGLDIAYLKLFITPFVVTLIFIMCVGGVVFPKMGEIKELKNDRKKLEKSISDVQAKISYIKSVDQNELKKNSEKLNAAIFAEKNSYYLIDTIRRVADEYGFQIRDFALSPGEVKQENEKVKKTAVNSVTEIPVDLTLVGPRERYLEFVMAMERNLPILSMDKFQLKIEKEMTMLDLTVVSFYVPDKEIGKIDSIGLGDLQLSKEESALLKKLSEFKKASSSAIKINTQGKDFVKYQRSNPFGF